MPQPAPANPSPLSVFKPFKKEVARPIGIPVGAVKLTNGMVTNLPSTAKIVNQGPFALNLSNMQPT